MKYIVRKHNGLNVCRVPDELGAWLRTVINGSLVPVE